MTPWPADVKTSFNNLSPTTSPMQQSAQDPFGVASCGVAPGIGMPQLNGQQQQQQQQQKQQQPPPQGGSADPWAAINAPTVAPGMPSQAPSPAQTITPPAAQPPAVVVADTGNKTPPSPMGDFSVLAAAGLGNSGVVPSVPNAQQMAGGMQQQPLQPNAQPTQVPTQAPGQAPPEAQAQAPAPMATANPFDFGPVATAIPQASPPANLPPRAPPSPPRDQQQVPQQQLQQQQMISPPTSPVPANSFAPQSTNYADPFGYAFTPMASPVTSPVTSPSGSSGGGAIVPAPSNAVNADPYDVLGAQPGAPVPAPAGIPPSIPNFAAQPPQQQPPQAPNAQIVPTAVPNADPFSAFGGQSAPTSTDPYGSSALVTSGPAPPAAGAVDDPFGIFGSPALAAAPVPTQTPAPQVPAPAPQEEDPWAGASFHQTVSTQPSLPMSERATSSSSDHTDAPTEAATEEAPAKLDSNGLPDDGEYYEARINARSLGAMFYTASNLEDTLYHKVPANVISAMESRPVVAYVAEDSAAWNSGIHLGHVILSVNGKETVDPEACARMIRNAPRPMNLRCWVPPALNLTLSEGKHLVKYDTKDLEAPGSSVEWKRKYVVVGGIVTKPWMMNMFYRKKDYDIAVKEAHASRKISVKVKQFDLRGARIILKGRDGKPNWVDYPSERRPWYYITILPNKGYPIKISSESLEELEPVYSAVRRFVRKDMEARYKYQVEESFGYGGSRDGGRGGTRNRNARQGGFHQFDDGPRNDYWR